MNDGQFQTTSSQNGTDSASSVPHITAPATEKQLEEKISELHQAGIEYEIEARSRVLGIGYVNFQRASLSPKSLGIIPEEDAQRLKIICFSFRPREVIEFAVLHPDDPAVQEYIKQLSQRYEVPSKIYLMSKKSFDRAMSQYRFVPKVRAVERDVKIQEEDLNRFRAEKNTLQDIGEQLKKISVTEILTFLMAAALQHRATDIHVEAEENGIKVRFRIDGTLHTIAELDRNLWRQIVSRIKLLAGLKINVDDRPQDGRVRLDVGDEKIDIRVSTLPTAYGESVAMRLLRTKMAMIAFEDLGLSGSALKRLKEQIQRPNGMVITSGPTGVGKTTTLYAIISKLNTPEMKIITIEDPIEYEIEGVNQSQVDPSKNYTFSKGLKSIVRQDPDVIMVGEMRDAETVDIAINAALTGHLVLSTIHTRNAAGTIPRLLALGAKGFLLAPALNAVIAQRLVRKLCSSCKKEISFSELDEQKRERMREEFYRIPETERGATPIEESPFFVSQGCEKCGGIGYQGRTGIFEVFIMSAELEQIILSRELSEYKIEDLLRQQGMVTMFQDGILKMLDGITSPSEVFRVVE